MSKKYPHFSPAKTPAPKHCWVGEQAKVCYDTRLEAEAAALVAQHDYGALKLSVYRCPYGDHYHLSSTQGDSVAK